MAQEQLFASFILDKQEGLEIALQAEHVSEATPIQGNIQKLPGSIPFLEGIMHLRDDVIPVINLKNRLNLPTQEYSAEAKIAVVSLYDNRYGLLFDDIKEVFRAEQDTISPISKALQTEDRVISALIKLESGRRTVELLDLKHLFKQDLEGLDELTEANVRQTLSRKASSYSRYVVFTCAGQEYGIPVDCSREITFCNGINDMFKTGLVEGAIELRGTTIPVISARNLLNQEDKPDLRDSEHTRVLVLSSEECNLGLIVDEVREILTIADDEILPFPAGSTGNVTGLYPRSEKNNVILIDMHNLVCNQLDSIKSMSRLGNNGHQENVIDSRKANHHLITENCYLVFSIGKNFAIELKDVQEIIENSGAMAVPGAAGFHTSIINLRGQVVPIVNLRRFYNFPDRVGNETNKLIICRGHGQTVALEVDQIVTIYKQEQFHQTPSLNAQLQERKDTVDRLIEYFNSEQIKEHVLVVNSGNLLQNHLRLGNLAANFIEKDIEKTAENITT